MICAAKAIQFTALIMDALYLNLQVSIPGRSGAHRCSFALLYPFLQNGAEMRTALPKRTTGRPSLLMRI